MSTRVLIAGVSARAAAESAARAGFEVTALDAFGDLDQHPGVRAIALPQSNGSAFTARRAAAAAEAFRADAVVYLSPFENHPRAVRRLARGRALWGNAPEVLRQVRTPELFAATLRHLGVPAPEIQSVPSRDTRAREWLIKPRASGGGHRIREWRPGLAVPRRFYLQERLQGVPASVVFVAACGRAAVLGVSRQIIGDAAFGAGGYRYCGSLLAQAGDPLWGPGSRLAARAAALAEGVSAACHLVGVNGIDLVVRGEVPVPIEVNPRWGASVELFERASGTTAFAAHGLACTAGIVPQGGPPLAPDTAHGKAVVFARRAVTVGDTRPWCEDGSVRDVPQPGTRVAAGGPVCTVFATGKDMSACYEALVSRADRIYARLSARPASLD